MVNSNNQIEVIHEGELLLVEPVKILNVPSATVHIENNISLVQKKIWFELIYKAFPLMGKQEKYVIELKELKELIGWKDTTSNDTELKDALYGLNKIAIQWNIFGKDKKKSWEAFPLLAGCQIPENSGFCVFEFSSFLEERFLAMGKEAYVKINLIVSNKFQSKYALSIYCLALDYLMLEIGRSEKKFSISELRRFLALKEGEYKLNGDLSRRIIKPAEEEINDISDMNIKIEPFKNIGSRKIDGYKLCMSLKEGKEKNYIDEKNILDENQIKNLIEENKKKLDNLNKLEELKIKTNSIKIETETLKKFFVRHNISTNTIFFQEKFKELENLFGGDMLKVEKYLIFLSKYAEKELENNNSIKNFAGFYISLFKDDNQIISFFESLSQEKLREKQKEEQIKNAINEKIKSEFEYYLTDDFDTFLENNIDRLEDIFIYIVSNKFRKSGFIYDFLIKEKNKSIIDKTLILNHSKRVRSCLVNELRNFKDDFGYKPISFDLWKEKNLTEEKIEKIKLEVEKKFN